MTSTHQYTIHEEYTYEFGGKVPASPLIFPSPEDVARHIDEAVTRYGIPRAGYGDIVHRTRTVTTTEWR